VRRRPRGVRCWHMCARTGANIEAKQA